MDYESSEDETDTEPEPTLIMKNDEAKNKSSIWSSLSSLVGSKQLSMSDVEPVIAKMRDHLIGKNVAAEVANKLCQSVASKLEGKVLGKRQEFLKYRRTPSGVWFFRNLFHGPSYRQRYFG